MSHYVAGPYGRGRRVLLMALAVLAALVTVGGAGPAGAADRLDRVTAGLRRSAVFVDPDVWYLLNGQDRARLEQRVRAQPFPIYVVAIPLLPEDESAGDPDRFAYALHRRFGRPGAYVVVDEDGTLYWALYDVPRQDAISPLSPDVSGSAPLPRRLDNLITALVNAPKAAPDEPRPPSKPSFEDARHDDSTGALITTFLEHVPLGLLIGALIMLPLVFLIAFVVGIVRAVRPGARRGSTLGARRLRRMAAAELARLARSVNGDADNPGRDRAMADYDAAALLHKEKTDVGSLFGVVVLALDARDALRERTDTPKPRCLLNPLHGPGLERVRFRPHGLSAGAWPLCADCHAAKTRGRSLDPRTLKLDLGDRKSPYYLASGLWEQVRGRQHTLPERTLEYLGVE